MLSPTEGETVSSPVTISGYGTAFEATISWEVYRDDEKVAEGFTQGGANGEFGEFTDTVDLDARHLRAAGLRVLRRGRLPAARRHQDLHRRVSR